MHVRKESGQSMTEYVLIIALVALVAFAAVKFLGKSTKSSNQESPVKVDQVESTQQ